MAVPIPVVVLGALGAGALVIAVTRKRDAVDTATNTTRPSFAEQAGAARLVSSYLAEQAEAATRAAPVFLALRATQAAGHMAAAWQEEGAGLERLRATDDRAGAFEHFQAADRHLSQLSRSPTVERWAYEKATALRHEANGYRTEAASQKRGSWGAEPAYSPAEQGAIEGQARMVDDRVRAYDRLWR